MIPLARAAGVSDFGLLLYPRKQLGLGKTMVNDESIILDAAEMRALSKALRSLKRSAQDTAPLWSFTQAVFYERFHTCCRMAGLQQTVHSYQVRHGAASEDALSKRRTLAEIQERHGYQEVQERYRVPGGASQGGPQSDRLRAGNGTGSCRRLRRQEGTSNPTNSNQITGAGDTFGSCSLPSGQALRKRLNFLLRQALSSSSYGQVFLDVFGGGGSVGAAVHEHSGWPCINVDIRIRPAWDLTDRRVVKHICGWIQSGVVRGIFLAWPCSTWSIASGGAYRRPNQLWGRPELLDHLARRVQLGNRTFKAAPAIIRSSMADAVPVIGENPCGSMAWQVGEMRKLLSSRACRLVHADQCQHGTRWKKATSFAGWHAGAARVCCPGGCCRV